MITLLKRMVIRKIMLEFPEFFRFEFGVYVDLFVKWLIRNFGGFFGVLEEGILWILLQIDNKLQLIPWWLVMIVVLILGWRLKKLSTGVIFVLMLFAVGSFGLWSLMMATLAIILTSVFISLLLGIPMGIITAYSSKLEFIMQPLLDGMQTMPSFVYSIPAIMLFGLGRVPAVFATTIYAIAPIIRLTNLGIRGVSREMVEAAHSFGSTPWQVLFKVELPQALPTIMTGVNQTTMMAVSMVVIASMVGAQGVGREVLQAINKIDIARGTEAGLVIVFLAIIIDRITQGVADKLKVEE